MGSAPRSRIGACGYPSASSSAFAQRPVGSLHPPHPGPASRTAGRAVGSLAPREGSRTYMAGSGQPAASRLGASYRSPLRAGSSLSAASRLHSFLLPDRHARGAADGAPASWKPAPLGSGVERLSQSGAGHERRPFLPYGTTVVDGGPSRTCALAKGGAPLPAGPLKCDKCDGAHATRGCPHFKKERDNHPDALVRKATGMGGEVSDGSVVHLTGARVRSQPGDGNCLFHSVSHGLGGGSTAQALRRELTSFIERNSEMQIAGTPLHQWVQWDSGTSVSAYARRMASGGTWGGGIELAAVAKLKAVNVSVFEPAKGGGPSTFKRIGQFVNPSSTQTVQVLYRGGVHYDALEGGKLTTVVAPRL